LAQPEATQVEAVYAAQGGWLRDEREVLGGAWLLIAPLTTMLHLQPGPLVLGALLWALVRRAKYRAAADAASAG
jgi:hypothetical protein